MGNVYPWIIAEVIVIISILWSSTPLTLSPAYRNSLNEYYTLSRTRQFLRNNLNI